MVCACVGGGVRRGWGWLAGLELILVLKSIALALPLQQGDSQCHQVQRADMEHLGSRARSLLLAEASPEGTEGVAISIDTRVSML